MATCKDCIHNELCNIHGYIDADECAVFKNKADFVEVVRCENCDKPNNDWIGCPYIEHLTPPPNHYCSYGEPINYGSSKTERK